MVELDQEVIERLRSELSAADERTLDAVLEADYVGEVAGVSAEDGTVRMLIVGSHPHLRDSNSVTVGLERFGDDPTGYYWLELEDSIDPDVRSVSADGSLQRVMDEYHRLKRELLQEDRSAPPEESSVESADLL